MRKTLATAALVPLLLAGATACSSTSSTSGTSSAPAAATPATTGDTSTGGTSAVDAYCQGVDDYVAEAKKALADPANADTSTLQQQAKELANKAKNLAAELVSNPGAATQVQECTKKLQDAMSGN